MRGPVQPRMPGCAALRHLAATALLLTLATAPATASARPVVPDAAARPAAKRTSVTEAAQARRLAAAVVAARTRPARERAVTAVLRSLGIGVVTAGGKPVVTAIDQGAAAGAHLYDFEVRTLAAALGRSGVKRYADVASTLSTSGFALSASQAMPAALVHDAVKGAVRAARRPGARGYLLVHLVRELGRRRGNDPAGPAATADVRLDVLQAWLISADFAIGTLRKLPARTTSLTRARAALSVTDACQKYRDAQEEAKKAEEADRGKVGAFVAGKVRGRLRDAAADAVKTYVGSKTPAWALARAKQVAATFNAAAELLKIIHGSLLALSVEVTAPGALPEAHWGHGSSGEVVEFQERVVMLDNYGDLLVKCGALAGLELPLGPIEGVEVNWRQLEGEIKNEGALDCPPSKLPVVGSLVDRFACVTKTDKNGIARLRLRTNGEAAPGVGSQTQTSGLVGGVALYQSAEDGGLTGFIGQYLFPKDGGGTRWFIGSHRCGGVVPAAGFVQPARARAAQAGATCGVQRILSGTITYRADITDTFAPYYVDRLTEEITLSLRMTYDEYDDANLGFVGLEDAGSTMTASLNSISDNDPDGCTRVKETTTSSYAGPTSPGGISTVGLGRSIIVPSSFQSAPSQSAGEATIANIISPTECLPTEFSSSDDANVFQIPPVAEAQVPIGARSATFNHSYTHPGPIKTGTETITGTLTWDQPIG